MMLHLHPAGWRRKIPAEKNLDKTARQYLSKSKLTSKKYWDGNDVWKNSPSKVTLKWSSSVQWSSIVVCIVFLNILLCSLHMQKNEIAHSLGAIFYLPNCLLQNVGADKHDMDMRWRKFIFSSSEKTFTSWALAPHLRTRKKRHPWVIIPDDDQWWLVNQLPSKLGGTWKCIKIGYAQKIRWRSLRAYYLFWPHSNLVVGGWLVNTNEFSTKMVWTLEFRRWRC